MWKEALLLIAVIGYVTSEPGQVDDAAGGSESPVDVPLNEETDAAMDALANFMGFTCPKGHRCLPVLDCLPCDYGTYKDSESSDLCERCPPDCTTLRKGAQSKEECVPFCPPGYEISECGKTCTKCRPGTYKSTWEKTTLCVQCPAGSNPLADKLGMNSESQCYAEDEPISETTTDHSLATHVPPTVTVTCQSASDCGFGGACYKGYCGCLTTSCSQLAYAAMPGCQHFCQCEITTQTWRLHSCNVHELFDERIDNCNWNYNVEADLCFSIVSCEMDTCAPPASADMCSYNSRKYMACLRNLHAQCNRSPANELSAASGQIASDLYTKLMDLLSPISTFSGMEAVYDDYMLQCLEDELIAEPTTDGLTTDGLTTTPIPHHAQYSTDHSTETTTDTSLLPTVPTVAVTCQSASDCGFGGACYKGYCGCLTTSCSRLAYAAMPGCRYFCQCEITTQTWRLHSCNVQELFDEKIDNCNWDFNVEPDLCFSSINCETYYCPLPPRPTPPASADICSYDSRKYVTCIRSLYAQCGHSPVSQLSSASGDIDTDLHTKLMELLSPITTVDGMESVYNDYVLQCLDHSTETTTDTSLLPTVPTVAVTCQSASDCGFGGACYKGYCGCLTTSCSRLAYAAMPGCRYFCQCEITTQTWRLHSCNVQELFDEKIDNCNWDFNVEPDLCFSSINCETYYCPLPPRPTPPASADICSYDSRKYVTCIRSLYAQCGYSPVSQLSSASGDIDADLYTKLMELLSSITTADGMESVYDDYVLQCLDDHNEPTETTPDAAETTTTRRPTTVAETGDCPMYCLLPPAEESNLCSALVDQYFACLDVCSTEAANDLLKSYMSLHSDIRSQLIPLLNNGDSWEYIYAWYLNECPDEDPTPGTSLTTQKTSTVETSPECIYTPINPGLYVTCQSAPECGPAGDCYGGYCGCLTSTCSDLAYVAMPGCGYFCQCEITTQTWRLHNCNNHELFDERIKNCNWNFSVAEDLCFSTVNCDLDTCPPPSSAELCSIDTRTYMTCLRSLYVQCGRHPTDELASAANLRDNILYRELVDLVEPVETVADMESVYYGYMYRCLAVTDV